MMEPLNECLRELRKQKGLTQEQLAQMVHVSRQTISHWENGRAVPDYDALHKLAAALDTNVSRLLGEEFPTPATEEQIAPSRSGAEEEQACQNSPVAMRRFQLLCYAVTALCVAALLFVLLPGKLQEDPYTIEWFQQERPFQEGQAYLELYTDVSPVCRQRNSRENYYTWQFELHIREKGNVPFLVEYVEDYVFDRDGNYSCYRTEGEDMNWGSPWIPAGLLRSFTCNQHGRSPMMGMGFRIKGTDANGNELEFRHYVPFSAEYEGDS